MQNVSSEHPSKVLSFVYVLYSSFQDGSAVIYIHVCRVHICCARLLLVDVSRMATLFGKNKSYGLPFVLLQFEVFCVVLSSLLVCGFGI